MKASRPQEFVDILLDLRFDSLFEGHFLQATSEWSFCESDPGFERGFYEGNRWADGDRGESVVRALEFVLANDPPGENLDAIAADVLGSDVRPWEGPEHFRGFFFGAAEWLARLIALRETI